MVRRNKYITLTILLAAALLLGLTIPAFLNFNPQVVEPGEFTPRPTSTRFRTPMADVREVAVPEEEPLIEDENTNCTYPLHYWQDRPDDWPAEIVLGGSVYSKEDVRDLFSIAEPDVPTRLSQQVYTTFLNILYGANYTVIERVLLDAASWLDNNPPGSQISEFSRREGLYMAQILEHYNEGEIGPGLCSDAPELLTEDSEGAFASDESP